MTSLSNAGSITAILGPMFSGKTTELLRLHERSMIAKRNCILVKYIGDTRYDPDLVSTHDKQKGLGKTIKAKRLKDIYAEIFEPNIQVVSIDEGQFFNDLAETCELLAQTGKVVYVAALNGTFNRQYFEQVALLLPYVDEIKHVTAVCVDCGCQAIFTFRDSTENTIEVIGGTDTYSALCRTCYLKRDIKRNRCLGRNNQQG